MSAVREPFPDACIPELANCIRRLAFHIEELYEHLERREQRCR